MKLYNRHYVEPGTRGYSVAFHPECFYTYTSTIIKDKGRSENSPNMFWKIRTHQAQKSKHEEENKYTLLCCT